MTFRKAKSMFIAHKIILQLIFCLFRYCNMNFIIFVALIGVILPWIFITYDIGCQWSKNFRKHMSEFPEHMQINLATRVDVAIPSWHINGLGEWCRKNFCLGYTRGAGRTCEEEVETTWSLTNALTPSVREMVPGARHDTLNDHWNSWNFRKIVGFHTFHSFILFNHQISLLVLLKRYLVFKALPGGRFDEC